MKKTFLGIAFLVLAFSLFASFAFAEGDASVTPSASALPSLQASLIAKANTASVNAKSLLRAKIQERLQATTAEKEQLRARLTEKLRAVAVRVKASNSKDVRCNQFADQNLRDQCLKTEFGIGELARQKNDCKKEDNSTNSTACLRELKNKTQDYFNFKFDRLLDSAEKFKEKGADPALVEAFEALVEQKRAEFVNATTLEQRKQIIEDVNDAWKEFKREASKSLVEKRLTVSLDKAKTALVELKALRDKLEEKGFTTTRLDVVITSASSHISDAENASSLAEKWTDLQLAFRDMRLGVWLAKKIADKQPLTPEPSIGVTPVPSVVAASEVLA